MTRMKVLHIAVELTPKIFFGGKSKVQRKPSWKTIPDYFPPIFN
jgi:hypothetical protein